MTNPNPVAPHPDPLREARRIATNDVQKRLLDEALAARATSTPAGLREFKERANATHAMPSCGAYYSLVEDLLSALARATSTPAGLREAATLIEFAHRHLLGDSDVSREDASAALLEARTALQGADR